MTCWPGQRRSCANPSLKEVNSHTQSLYSHMGKVANPHDELAWSKAVVRKSKPEGGEFTHAEPEFTHTEPGFTYTQAEVAHTEPGFIHTHPVFTHTEPVFTHGQGGQPA
jgi:hypothetical protein